MDAVSPAPAFKYWAFISYSHADERWASWLHRALERYRVPRRLVGRSTPGGAVPARLFPVFRDRDELAGSSALGPELRKALQQSRYLIVIASPHAARSRWVAEEIAYFKSLGRADRVLALIVSGEPHAADPARECFPPPLRLQVDAAGALTDIPSEPIAADARPGGDGRGNATLKLIAGVLGVAFDELRRRELQARNRRLAFAAGLAGAVSAVTIALAIQAWHARNDALRRQQQAEDLLQFMLGDLRDKLEPIGKLSILDAVGAKAIAYFATLDPADVTDGALSSRATALRQIGEVRVKQGDLAGASEAFAQALRLDEELVSRHPTDTRSWFNVGESQHYVGYAHYVKGEMDLARPWFVRHVRTAERLLALEPDEPKWINKWVEVHNNLGALEIGSGQFDAAAVAFGKALARQEALVAADPDNRDYLISLAAIHSWLWSLETQRRNFDRALAQAERQSELRRRLVALEPDNAGYRKDLAAANLTTLYSESHLRPVAADAPVLRETLTLTAELLRLDGDNIEYARNRVVALNYLVDAELASGRTDVAGAAVAELLALARSTYQRAPANASVIDDLLGVLAQAAKVAWLAQDSASAVAHLREAEALPLTSEQLGGASPSRWLDLSLLDWALASAAPGVAARQTRVETWLERARAAGRVAPALMLHYELLRGDLGAADGWFAQLASGERAHPFVKEICRRAGACADKIAGTAATP